MNGMVVATDPITRMTLVDSEESDACLPALSFFQQTVEEWGGRELERAFIYSTFALPRRPEYF